MSDDGQMDQMGLLFWEPSKEDPLLLQCAL